MHTRAEYSSGARQNHKPDMIGGGGGGHRAELVQRGSAQSVKKISRV